MLNGVNHITFAVRDLQRSIDFYCNLLGCVLHAEWQRGAYVTSGDNWICLSVDADSVPARGYGHIAFSINADDLPVFESRLAEHHVEIWQTDSSEGASVYFVDPDGHRLEAHVGGLETRLSAMREHPYLGQTIVADR